MQIADALCDHPNVCVVAVFLRCYSFSQKCYFFCKSVKCAALHSAACLPGASFSEPVASTGDTAEVPVFAVIHLPGSSSFSSSSQRQIRSGNERKGFTFLASIK